MENIQDEVMKIHHKYGTTEMANYQIQLLFDKNYSQLQTRIKEMEEEKTTMTYYTDNTEHTMCCAYHVKNMYKFCPNCGRKIIRK